MRSIARTFAVVWIGLWSVAFGQSAMQLRFLDSQTGFSIRPDQVSIGQAHWAVTLQANQLQNGRLYLPLPDGWYTVSISAQGYRSMTSSITVKNGVAPATSFFLDPVKQPVETTASYISSFHTPYTHVLVGFVSDDDTGTPLSGATVTSLEGAVSTTTGANGSFMLSVPIPNPTPDGKPKTTLVVSKSGYRSEQREYIELWPYGDTIYTIRLAPGGGVNVVDERRNRRWDNPDPQLHTADCKDCTDEASQSGSATGGSGFFHPMAGTPPTISESIRVGRNCPTSTTCSTVEVYTVDTYCKHVLVAEWFSCWGSLTNGLNSLEAGSIAVRSYGVWHVYNPKTANYDICDTTSCQVFGASTTTNGNTAVDATTRYVVVDSNNAIARAEYAAENNDKNGTNGCGNGYTGTNTVSNPCISDMPCVNQTYNGHGRGMCQWGTVRWATGTVVATSPGCSLGPSHGLGAQTWQWIVGHYYPLYTLEQASTATITGISACPNPINAGGTFTATYGVNATDSFATLLDLSITPVGGGSTLTDAAHVTEPTLPAGTSNQTRLFTVSGGAATGAYNIAGALWYDRNNSNTINSGDFVVDSYTNPAGVTVQSGGTSIVFSPTSVSFGNVGLGQQPTINLTITNQAGSATNLTGSVGTLGAPFSIVSGGGSFNLAPGQSKTVVIRFSPVSAGFTSTSLSVTHNATNACSPSSVTVSGNGVAINANFNPTSVNFGNVRFGQSSTDQLVTITCQVGSAANLTGNVPSLSPPFMLVAGGGNFNIPPGGSTQFSVRYTPTAGGTQTTSLNITHNGTNIASPAVISLTGFGLTANLTVAPNPVAFEDVPVGQSPTMVMTISNQASATSNLSGSVGSTTAPMTVISGGGAFDLAPGASKNVTIQFSPTSLGAISRSLSITHNATNVSSPTVVNLTGTGVNNPLTTVTATFNSDPAGCDMAGRAFTLKALSSGETVNGFVDGSGQLTAQLTTTGATDICVKVEGTLSKRVNGVNLPGSGSVNLGALTVTSGDADGNDGCDDGDLISAILDFGGPPSGSNGYTDFDCDGQVNDADLIALIVNFGLTGDCVGL